MSYLGRGVDAIDNISTLDNLTFSGSTATYNLTQNSVAFTPVSADALQIQIDGIIQIGNYSVSGSTVTFDFTPSGSSVCNGIKHFGVGLITSVSDGAVTTAKIGTDAVTVDKVNLVSTSSVPSLEAKGDGSSQDGYIQLNCSQNSHGVKIKSPAHSAAQSYTLTLPGTAPAANKMLQTDGSGNLSFVDAPSGGLAYVGGGSTTSNVASVNLDNVFSATYDNYLLVFDMTSNENGDAILHFRSAGGSPATQTGSAYRYAFMGLDTGGGSESAYGNNNSNFQIGHGMYDHEELDYPALSGYIYFNSPFSSSHVKSFNGNFHNRASNGETRGFAGGGCFANQTSCGGVRLSFSTGSVNNCTARMYGLVNS